MAISVGLLNNLTIAGWNENQDGQVGDLPGSEDGSQCKHGLCFMGWGFMQSYALLPKIQ